MAINEKEQFSLIYEQYIEKIYRFVYIKVSSREIAEDLTSKVFLKGWKAYEKGQKIKNEGAFLYHIARNIIIDHYRDRDRTKTVSMEHVAQMSDSSINLHEKAVLNADIELILSAIKNLKKEYQDVLIFYYLEDMPSEQIAQILDKPVGTVRVMIHRALESLRVELAKV